MVISKDQSIIMQVAAKVAVNFVPQSDNVEAMLTDWEVAFNFVNDKLQEKNGVNAAVETIKEVFPNATETTSTSSDNAVIMAPRASVSVVKVAGTQHGDLPNWVIEQAQKRGVTKIWDNRDVAVGTRRPWFKSADGTVDAKGDPIPFWPPKDK